MSAKMETVSSAPLTERYEALLRVSQTLISNRSPEELLSVLARELREVAHFHYLGVGIYDEKAHEVRVKMFGESGNPLGSKTRTGRNLDLVGVPASTALDNFLFRSGRSIPSGNRATQEPRDSFYLHATLDDSAPPPRGPRREQHRGAFL